MYNILEDASNRLLSNLKSLTIKKFPINIEDVRKEMSTENTWLADNRKSPQQPLSQLFNSLDEITESCLIGMRLKMKKLLRKC